MLWRKRLRPLVPTSLCHPNKSKDSVHSCFANRKLTCPSNNLISLLRILSVCLDCGMRLLKQYQEGELVKLLRQGDMKAFDELYFRYVPRLLSFSKTYIKVDEEAEEAVQEIFIRIWEKRKSLDESKSFKSYLFQSIKNHFLNLIRDRKTSCQLSDIPEELLVSRENVFEDLTYKELEETAYEWAQEILQKSPTSIKMLKFAFNLTDDGMVGQQVFAGEATRLAYMTDEATEGRNAFLEKRKPNFQKKWLP